MPILSPTVRTIESMFEGQTDADVVDAIAAAAREQNVQCARELAAIGELYARRAPVGDTERDQWAIDGHANVVAEISAALRITEPGPVGTSATRSRYASGCHASRRYSREETSVFEWWRR